MTDSIDRKIEEITQSYYKYIVKIEGGAQYIVSLIQQKDFASAANQLQALSEGLMWVLDTEKLLAIHSYRIENPVSQVVPLFMAINDAIEQGNMPKIARILEENFIPLFKHAKNWRFQQIVS